MPFETPGVSFVPGQNGEGGEAPQGTQPLQSAVRLLSLRLPRITGAQGLAPGQLLNAPGGMGMGGGNAMANPLFQALLRLAGIAPGGDGPAGPAGPGGGGGGFGFGGGGSPTRVIPGEEARQPGPGLPTPFQPGGGPFIDRSSPGMGNRGTDQPLVQPGPVGRQPGPGREWLRGRQGFDRGY